MMVRRYADGTLAIHRPHGLCECGPVGQGNHEELPEKGRGIRTEPHEPAEGLPCRCRAARGSMAYVMVDDTTTQRGVKVRCQVRATDATPTALKIAS